MQGMLGMERMLACALVAGLGAGCGSPYPPRGPHHDPVDSPEASTPCPREREAATAARQRVLADPGQREAAGEAVLRHAGCEARAIAGAPPPRGGREAIVAGLRGLRARFDAARNLYEEVAGYGIDPLSVRALVGQAELGQQMAALLAAMAPPDDVTDAAARAELVAEQEDLVRTFAGEAVVAAERALAVAAADGAVVAGLEGGARAACAIVERLDPHAARPPCRVAPR